MRGKPGLWLRTRTLEATFHRPSPADLHALAEEIAAEFGITPAEVLADAEALVARFQQSGARTARQEAEVLAAELGCEADVVMAEVERLRQETGE